MTVTFYEYISKPIMFVEIGVGIVNPRGFGSKDHVESFPHDIDSLLV